MTIPPTKTDLESNLANHVLEITFIKADGDHRYMKCTRDVSRIPAEHLPKSKEEGSVPRVESDEVVRVYDIDAEGWRSFRVDSLISDAIYEV